MSVCGFNQEPLGSYNHICHALTTVGLVFSLIFHLIPGPQSTTVRDCCIFILRDILLYTVVPCMGGWSFIFLHESLVSYHHRFALILS